MKDFLQSIADDVNEIFTHEIETPKTYGVPGRSDRELTFGRNQIKKGKLISTCVLFIDIRNSTVISKKLKNDKAKLGKIYSAFVDAMATIADRYGYVRNIIGDRVMVVFEPSNCFVDAINCAVTMHTVAVRILKKYSGLDDFKCGIGIEYGEMLILKTGIQKRNEEQSEYKNLVWVGDAANTASKLTDFSNKEYNSPLYKITYEYITQERFLKENKHKKLSILDIYFGNANNIDSDYEWKFVKKNTTINLSAIDFNKKVKSHPEWKYEDKKIIGIEKVEQNGITSPILMSGKVYAEFKKAIIKSPLLESFTKKQYPNEPYTGTGIYGGYAYCPDIAQIKI